MAGKRAGYWSPRSADGAPAFGDGSPRAGAYLLKVRIAGIQGVKRIAI